MSTPQPPDPSGGQSHGHGSDPHAASGVPRFEPAPYNRDGQHPQYGQHGQHSWYGQGQPVPGQGGQGGQGQLYGPAHAAAGYLPAPPGAGGPYGPYGPYALGRNAEPSTYGNRAGSYIIDRMVITFGGYAILLGLVFAGFGLTALIHPEAMEEGADPPPLMIAFMAAAMLGWALFGFTYRVWMHAAKGKTLGKMALRIRLVNAADGSAPGWGACFVRELVHAVLIWTIIGFYIDLLWPLWDDRRQTLHDKAAKTLVVPA